MLTAYLLFGLLLDLIGGADLIINDRNVLKDVDFWLSMLTTIIAWPIVTVWVLYDEHRKKQSESEDEEG